MSKQKLKSFTFKERREITSALERRATELDFRTQPLSVELLNYATQLFEKGIYGSCITCRRALDLKVLLVRPEIMYCDKCYFNHEDMLERENIKLFIDVEGIPTLKSKNIAIKRLLLNSLLANRNMLTRFNTRKSFKAFAFDANPVIHSLIIGAIERNFDASEFVGITLNEYYQVNLDLNFPVSIDLIPYLDESKTAWVEINYAFQVEETEKNEEVNYLRLLNTLNLKTCSLRFVSNMEYSEIKSIGSLTLPLNEVTDNLLELIVYTLRYNCDLLKSVLDQLSGNDEPALPLLPTNKQKGWSIMDIGYAFNRYTESLPADLAPLVYYFSDLNEFRIIFPLFNEKTTSKGELAFSFDRNEVGDDGVRGFVELPLELSNSAALELVSKLNQREASISNVAPWISGNWINVEQEGRNIILYSVFIPHRFRKYSAFEEHIGNIISEVVKSWEYHKVTLEFLQATEGEELSGE